MRYMWHALGSFDRLVPGAHPAGGEGLWGTEREPPSFLYAMPLGEGRVFLEETCLVAKPPLPFSTLKRRLHRRLAAMGLKVCSIFAGLQRVLVGTLLGYLIKGWSPLALFISEKLRYWRYSQPQDLLRWPMQMRGRQIERQWQPQTRDTSGAQGGSGDHAADCRFQVVHVEEEEWSYIPVSLGQSQTLKALLTVWHRWCARRRRSGPTSPSAVPCRSARSW